MHELTSRLRSIFERNSTLGYVAVGVCLLIAGYMLFGRNAPANPGHWYYDLETGDVVAHDVQSVRSPITLPNGHAAVLLHRFACGACADGEIWNGYLYKVTDQWRAAQHNDDDEQPIAPTEGELVALVPEDGLPPQWVDRHHAQGVSIVDVRSRCPGEHRPERCLPR
jgi:hypothetical protein